VPVAVNCCEPPNPIAALAGVTAIDARVALVTLSVAVPICPAKAAEIVVAPGAVAVASPKLPLVLLIVPTEEADDVQVTTEVKSWVSPLANVPRALNCTLMVAGTLVL